MIVPLQEELEVAERAVHTAAILTKRVLESVDNGSIVKTDDTPVTIADFGAQALLIAILRAACPDVTFVGEEDSAALRNDPVLRQKVWDLVSTTPIAGSDPEVGPQSEEEMMDLIDLGKSEVGTRAKGHVWVMDPVDGTATFQNKQQYVVALSLLKDGIEQFTVLGCPNLVIQPGGRISESVIDQSGLGYRMIAVRGHGSFCRRVSGPDDTDFKVPDQLPTLDNPTDRFYRLWIGDAVRTDPVRFVNWDDPASIDVDRTQLIAKQVGGSWLDTTIWSAQLRYVAVALGGADAMVRLYRNRVRKSNVHDHAGGRLLVVEAGGHVTDLDGRELDFSCGRKLINNHGFVAATRAVHSEVLEAVQTQLQSAGLAL